MAIIKPFKGIRPPKELVEEVACLPYDVMNSDEAVEMAKGKDASLLHKHVPKSNLKKVKILIVPQSMKKRKKI